MGLIVLQGLESRCGHVASYRRQLEISPVYLLEV